MADLELKTLQLANFDWAVKLQNIWEDHPYHVPGMQNAVHQEFARRLDELTNQSAASSSPLGWVVQGTGGAGKTHVVGKFREVAAERGCAFILVDMTDVRDFWETVLNGFFNSLQEPFGGSDNQYRFLLERLMSGWSSKDQAANNLKKLTRAKPETLRKYANTILSFLSKRWKRDTAKHQDVIRALVAINADDFSISNIGQTWLQGLAIEPEDAKAIGLRRTQDNPRKIIEALSWLISLCAPCVIAFDQLDPIVRQLEYEAVRSEEAQDRAGEALAASIISKIGDGLRDLNETTCRSLIVLSCLETSWDIIHARALASSSNRFKQVDALKPIGKSDQAAAIVATRMRAACEATGLQPAYDTWPFRPAAFESLDDATPRELLMKCELHRAKFLRQERVWEIETFGQQEDSSGSAAKPTHDLTLDQRLLRYQQEADVSPFTDEKQADELFMPILQSICVCLQKECKFPTSVDSSIDTVFTGGEKSKPLHARLRLIFQDEQEREEHYAVRALQRKNAKAFQNRLKLAMTQAGIDKHLSFRHLVILRSLPVPGGQVTQQLVSQFEAAGGVFYQPDEQEFRQLVALDRLYREWPEGFEEWLRQRCPATQLGFCQAAFAAVLDRYTASVSERLTPTAAESLSFAAAASPGPAEAGAETLDGLRDQETDDAKHGDRTTAKTQEPDSGEQKNSSRPLVSGEVPSDHPGAMDANDEFSLGYTFIGETLDRPVKLPLQQLERHTVVLAGAGSGKTVLLKRLIEQAALQGIPSIVIDGANDLASLGDAWTQAPLDWFPGDEIRAERYHRDVQTVVWTPGVRRGNPVRFDLIPDLTPLLPEDDDLREAIQTVRAALAERLELKKSKADQNKRGIIDKTLEFFVREGHRGIGPFIEMLDELPEGAQLGIDKEAKLAREIADGLRVQLQQDPLLDDVGQPLDPALLFGDDQPRGPVRISVLNLAGLPGHEAQQQFVGQLATELFAWVKRHPNPPNRALRGLLVIDEAKDFIPSRKSNACKDGLMRLTAQARKYHLGLIYATQNPREIENTIIGNCSTHYYGKVSAPAAVETIREQIRLRGREVNDVASLPRGTFYVFNAEADMRAPQKVRVPLCLSHHTTLDPEQVVSRAQHHARSDLASA